MSLIALGWVAPDSPVAPLQPLCTPRHAPATRALADMALSPRWSTSIAAGDGIKVVNGDVQFAGHLSEDVRRKLKELASTVLKDWTSAVAIIQDAPIEDITKRAIELVLQHKLSEGTSVIIFDQGSALQVGTPRLSMDEIRDPNIFPIGGLMPARLSVEEDHLVITLLGMLASGPFAKEEGFNQIVHERFVRNLGAEAIRSGNRQLLHWIKRIPAPDAKIPS